jgi:glyoxylase-like metal-dependent hydrolase (beta-lactamase superfamily II)
MSERTAGEEWREIADRVYVRRHRALDLNIGLVLGAGTCLVVDTRSSEAEARELVEAVRRVTPWPWVVVDTHHHYDHSFGNSVFRPAQIWAHRRCAEMLVEYGEVKRQLSAASYRKHGLPDTADAIELTRIDPPDRLVDTSADLDVGGRRAVLRYLGRGHTDNDLVVEVPDAGVLFAGDLIEEGAPPMFGDAFPLEWPDTVAALGALAVGPVVPGHGAVVDAAYVQVQQAELATIAELARTAYAAGQPIDAVLGQVPYPEPFARGALERAFRQLRGEPAYDPPAEALRRGLAELETGPVG